MGCYTVYRPVGVGSLKGDGEVGVGGGEYGRGLN